MKKKITKIILPLLAVGLITVLVIPFPSAQTRVKSYHSGDAIVYDGYTVIATTNTGELELFKVQPGDNEIVKFAGFASYNPRFDQPENFVDVLLRLEDARLYAYAVDGRSLFKYDISDLAHARLVNQVQDGGWDWFGNVEIIDGKLATAGSRGVKIWNNDLVVLDAYTIINPKDNTYNTTSAGSERYLFSIYQGKIKIFDRTSRSFTSEVPLEFKWGSNWYKRQIYSDRHDDALYVVDDEAVRKVNFRGEIIKSFKHTSNLGYDVVPSTNENYVYFTDGIGIVKLRTSDLSVVTYTYTTALGNGEGWAMGMKVINDGSGEKIIIFNNGSIIMLDENLQPLKHNNQASYVIATKQETFPDVIEPLGLSADKNRGAANSTVILSGRGYGANEPISIMLAETNFTTNADSSGRFTTTLTVPDVAHRRTDIKVLGLITKYSYSLGFEIE